MQIKKYNVLFAIALLVSSLAFAQSSSSGYSVFDTTVISKKGMPQQQEFLNNTFNFPAKPRSMWELGFSVGNFMINGDVTSVAPTFGFSAHVRKSLGYVLSLRADYLNGSAKGLNWNGSGSWVNNKALNTVYSTGDIVYYNYKNKTQDLTLSGLVSLNNIKFHQDKSKIVVYAGAGFGATAYQTMINAKNEATGKNYADLYKSVYTTEARTYSNRKSILSKLKAGMDDSYETAAENASSSKPKLGDQSLAFSTSFILGLEYKLSKNVNLAIEDRHVVSHDDLMDGQRWQEHPVSDPALTGQWDSYNYLSLGLNFNVGAKSVEPLWWINPLDYAYSEINNPKHTKMPEPVLKDADGDGITDQLDKEPNSPSGTQVDAHGVAKDTDGDGVPDYKDKQLVTPTECQPVNADGVGTCPTPECCKSLTSKMSELQSAVANGSLNGNNANCPTDYPSISFNGNASSLAKDAKAMLDKVADKMKANPKCNVVVNGYPEASKASQAVCQQRSEAISKYLISNKGISADRITTNCTIGGGDKNTVDIKSN